MTTAHVFRASILVTCLGLAWIWATSYVPGILIWAASLVLLVVALVAPLVRVVRGPSAPPWRWLAVDAALVLTSAAVVLLTLSGAETRTQPRCCFTTGPCEGPPWNLPEETVR